jgi:dihydrodipicolinate reductase
MVATRKYKETYDMQVSRRKATWFNMQKLVVNNYALGVLVLKVRTTPQGSYFDRITESHHDRPTT